MDYPFHFNLSGEMMALKNHFLPIIFTDVRTSVEMECRRVSVHLFIPLYNELNPKNQSRKE